MLVVPQTDAILVERRVRCCLCGGAGLNLYGGLSDRIHSVPGTWSLRRCTAIDCGLVWLDPMPAEQELPRLYPHDYFTHVAEESGQNTGSPPGPLTSAGWVHRLSRAAQTCARSLRRACGMTRAAGRSVLWLRRESADARLLDVGCGNGDFLARMRLLGWHTTGVEPDKRAAHVAQTRYGLDVHCGSLDTLPTGVPAFDAITFSHVIEHLPNPLNTLKRSLRLLKPGGQLVVVTPNGTSLGSRYFGPDWVAWDPPRHLYVFTPRSLRRLLLGAGFGIEREWTTGRSARWVWKASTDIRRTGRCANVAHPAGTSTARYAGHLARCIEAGCGGAGTLGEELVAICVRKADVGNRDAASAAA